MHAGWAVATKNCGIRGRWGRGALLAGVDSSADPELVTAVPLAQASTDGGCAGGPCWRRGPPSRASGRGTRRGTRLPEQAGGTRGRTSGASGVPTRPAYRRRTRRRCWRARGAAVLRRGPQRPLGGDGSGGVQPRAHGKSSCPRHHLRGRSLPVENDVPNWRPQRPDQGPTRAPLTPNRCSTAPQYRHRLAPYIPKLAFFISLLTVGKCLLSTGDRLTSVLMLPPTRLPIGVL